jgi:hypothetical protein
MRTWLVEEVAYLEEFTDVYSRILRARLRLEEDSKVIRTECRLEGWEHVAMRGRGYKPSA